MSDLKTVRLGDVCVIEKGATGIQKAIPGEYPLVVTSEERKTHNTFQFDADAVIVPLVSSTGHGHASIKRIHYQSGKFALGSILCAIIPKDKSKLSAEYLYRYLDLNKDAELVGRMKGMANVTLPIKEISKIEIPLPSLAEQRKIVAVLDNQLAKIEEVVGLCGESQTLIDQLLPAALNEIFSSTRSKGWDEIHIGDKKAMYMTSGGTPSRANKKYYEGNHVWLKSGELNDNVQITDSEEHISDEALKKSSAKIFPAGTVLIAMYGATAGKLGILARPAATNQAVAGLMPDPKQLNSKYLFYCLQNIREKIIQQAWGGAQPNLSQTILKEFKVPLPPIVEQEKIVKELDALSGKALSLHGLQFSQSIYLKSLKQAISHEVFVGHTAHV